MKGHGKIRSGIGKGRGEGVKNTPVPYIPGVGEGSGFYFVEDGVYLVPGQGRGKGKKALSSLADYIPEIFKQGVSRRDKGKGFGIKDKTACKKKQRGQKKTPPYGADKGRGI
jgi:hypothetical protein